MNKEFKRLANYPKYEINHLGVVRKIKSKHELTPQAATKGGEKAYVRVVRDGKAHLMHKGSLFATAFVRRETKNHNFLICKDGNWLNLSEENFEWVNPVSELKEDGITWKPVKGYEKIYIVSEFGDIKNITTQKMMSCHYSQGKACVTLYNDGKRQTMPIDKIVARAFLEGTPSRYIRHINGDNTYCHYKNLAWGEHPKKKYKGNQTEVNEYSIDGEFIKKWSSINQAAQTKNIPSKHIYYCCMGKNKTAGGRVWRYEGDDFGKFRTTALASLLDGEKFVELKEASGYEISNRGRLRNLNRGGAIHVITKTGYVELTIDGHERHKKFGNLVAKYFLPNPEGCKRVEFLDGNPANCDVDNLMWVKK